MGASISGVCPSTIVVQTDWFPETDEHGVYYHMLGPTPKIDVERKRVSGPLVVEGQDTGVQLEVRSGGPATDFKLVSEQIHRRTITLGQVNTDEAIRFSAAQPTLAMEYLIGSASCTTARSTAATTDPRPTSWPLAASSPRPGSPPPSPTSTPTTSRRGQAVNYALVNDNGYPFCPQALAIRTAVLPTAPHCGRSGGGA
jgi:hypothetical protein